MALPSTLHNARMKILLLKNKYSKDISSNKSRSTVVSSPLSSDESLIEIYRESAEEKQSVTLLSNETELKVTADYSSAKEFKLVENNSISQEQNTNVRTNNSSVTYSTSKQSLDCEEVRDLLSKSLEHSLRHHHLNQLRFFSSSSDEASIKEEVSSTFEEIPSSPRSIQEKLATFSEPASYQSKGSCSNETEVVSHDKEELGENNDSVSINSLFSPEPSLEITKTGGNDISTLNKFNYNIRSGSKLSKQEQKNNVVTEFISGSEFSNVSSKIEFKGSDPEHFIQPKSKISRFQTRISSVVDRSFDKNNPRSQESVEYASRDSSAVLKFVGDTSQFKSKTENSIRPTTSSAPSYDKINYIKKNHSLMKFKGMREGLVVSMCNQTKLSTETDVNRKHYNRHNKLLKNCICVKPKKRPILKSCILIKHDETNKHVLNTQTAPNGPRDLSESDFNYYHTRTGASCDKVVKQLLQDQIQLTRHFIKSHHEMYLLCCQAVKALNEQ